MPSRSRQGCHIRAHRIVPFRMLRTPVTKWIVVVVWLLLLVGSAGLAGKLTEAQDNRLESWLPSDAESTRVLDELAPFGSAESLTTIVVYEKTTGLSRSDMASIREQAARMQQVDGVVGEAVGPRLAPDGQAAQVSLTFDFGPGALEEMPAAADALRERAEMPGGKVYLTGEGGQFVDEVEVFADLDSTLTLTALGVVILILLFAYRSPVMWLLPIGSVVVGLVVSQALVYLLVQHTGLVVNAQSQGLLSILVIGAGTDYALLLVARYREELHQHADRHAAMAAALPRVLPAMLASACTVAAALVCLAVADIGATAGMGPVAALGILVTFLAMATLLPALLLIGGRWIFWPRRPRPSDAQRTGIWHVIGIRIARAPRLTWLVTTAALVVGALRILALDADGLSTDEQYTTRAESVTGQESLERHELSDDSQPTYVVTDTGRVDQVDQELSSLGASVRRLGSAGGRSLLGVHQPHDPLSKAAHTAVHDVRAALRSVPDTLVGGTAAQSLDYNVAASHDNRTVIPLVLLVVLGILLLLLRSLVAPILLILTVVLSFGTALGVASVIFNLVGFAGAEPSLPLLAFVFLVALGVDYNIFLVARIREETARSGTRMATRHALASTGGVITAAGLVLAATFAVLATLPLVSIAEIGITVAIGVLIDTLIVRSVLVTALALDIGDRMWWPQPVPLVPSSTPENP